MIPVGISTSTTILVGNQIGSLALEQAKFYAKMCIVTAFIWSSLSVFVMNALKSTIIISFSSDINVNIYIL